VGNILVKKTKGVSFLITARDTGGKRSTRAPERNDLTKCPEKRTKKRCWTSKVKRSIPGKEFQEAVVNFGRRKGTSGVF